jgi:predicted CopG family antitoxin
MPKTLSQNKIVISYDAFNNLKKLKEELESIIETIEIMNDEALMEGIKRSKDDVKAGRVHELKSVDDLDEVWV